jgi:Cytochrome C1 family
VAHARAGTVEIVIGCGDIRAGNRFIATVPGRGYPFSWRGGDALAALHTYVIGAARCVNSKRVLLAASSFTQRTKRFARLPRSCRTPIGENSHVRGIVIDHAAQRSRRLSGCRCAHSPSRAHRRSGKDIAAFLMWAAEPHLVARKRIGVQVMIFLIVLTGLLYFTKKRVWSAAPNPRD